MAPKNTKGKRNTMVKTEQNRNQRKSSKKIDIIGKLPVEVAHEILLQLNPDSVPNAWNTSQNWRYLMNTEYFWKRKCKKDNIFSTDSTVKSKVFRNLSEKLGPWHAIYTYNQGLNYNWKTENSYGSSLGHQLYYKDIHLFDDEKIIYTTIHNHLVILDYTTNLEQRISLQSDEEIDFMEIHEDFLICISSHYLYVWNIKTTEYLLFMLSEVPEYIFGFQIYDNSTLAIANLEGTFSTIDLDSGRVDNVWDNVNSFVKYKDLAILQTGINEITILNMKENSSLVSQFICCEEQSIINMMSRENYLICVCGNGNVSTWDIVTQTKLMSIDLNSPITHPFHFELLDKDRFIYSRFHSNIIEIWDFLVGTCAVKITTNENVRVIATDRYIFAMLLDFDTSTKVFCSKTGALITTLSGEIYNNSNGVPLVTESKLVALMANETDQGSLTEIVILDYEKQLSIPTFTELEVTTDG